MDMAVHARTHANASVCTSVCERLVGWLVGWFVGPSHLPSSCYQSIGLAKFASLVPKVQRAGGEGHGTTPRPPIVAERQWLRRPEDAAAWLVGWLVARGWRLTGAV
ncbi:hypothetical protein BKA81DRAFT_119382 [Phyllosticta paracitricarpa]